MSAFTHAFADPGTTDRAVLGGKGAGLVKMVALGLPVPPGFVIGTDAGRAWLETSAFPAGLEQEVSERMTALEQALGRSFGALADPLLVSVRSGAPVSMPGMMDTILNVGLTTESVTRMDSHFAWSSYVRLLTDFARTVRGINAGVVEETLMDARGDQAQCEALLQLIADESGSPFPDARGQLVEAIGAVFKSWTSRRAKAYRKHKGIDESMGTAVVVQAMVFGNRDPESGSGVAFTRDPSTGKPGAFGDFLFEAQGEDVVSGEHDADPLDVLEAKLPAVHAQLLEVFQTLEQDERDLCDIEFTVESGELFILQTRRGQRSGRAAVRVAVDMVDEGLIDSGEAVERVDEEQLAGAQAPAFADELDQSSIVARGLAASPGAALGRAVFDADRAQTLAEDGDVILLRPTTSPSDIPGVIAAVGVVTGRGGRMSHAAVVARGMGRPAVCGAGELTIAADKHSATLAGETIEEGELLAVDGDRGIVSRGDRPTVPAEQNATLARFLEWKAAATV